MTSDVAPEAISAIRRRTSRLLAALAAAGAAVAAVSSIPLVAGAEAQNAMVETWRLYGLLVFAGLFLLLAWRPHGYRWLWEIVILNKLLLTLTAGYFLLRGSGVEGAGAVLVADGLLTVVLLVAYCVARGWRSR